MSSSRKLKSNKGSGLLNSIINRLPVELHYPGYQFCGPGTRLRQRLAAGQRGINRLDNACREHDIAYDKSDVFSDRHEADRILQEKAWAIFKSKDTGLKEKLAAWTTVTAMRGKRKMGMGCGLGGVVSAAKKSIQNMNTDCSGKKNLMQLVKTALAAAKKVVSKRKSKSKLGSLKNKTPRILPIPKQSGGIIPLVPLFAGLSALGALAGGAANVVKTINDFKTSRNSPVHIGKGLYLHPYKGGRYKIEKGLYPKSRKITTRRKLKNKKTRCKKSKN